MITLRSSTNIIYNNSVVNLFNYDDSKRAGVVFRVQCTTVQRDELPKFKAEFFTNPGVINTINEEAEIGNLYSIPNGLYQNTMAAIVSQSISGRYWCESAVSGVSTTFIITAG